ncbi:MAG: DUF6444 domain-containing protein [Burkholderiales bacterium]
MLRLLDALDRMAGALEDVAGLQARIEELERQLGRNSRNSSVAPSSDPPLTRQQRRQLARERASKALQREGRQRREQGAQPGHEGAVRDLAGPDELTDGPMACAPHACGCGYRFSGSEQQVGEAVCHQQWELPPVAVQVREWRRLRFGCPGCGRAVLAELPAGVGPSAFGPRLHAHVLVHHHQAAVHDTHEARRLGPADEQAEPGSSELLRVGKPRVAHVTCPAGRQMPTRVGDDRLNTIR